MKKAFLGILAVAILVSAGATASLAAGVGSGRRFVDANDDGVCDYADSGCAYVDADGDGVCDYADDGCAYVDADGDGVCDHYVSGQGRGYGWGHGHGQGHHRQGRGCGFRGGCGR